MDGGQLRAMREAMHWDRKQLAQVCGVHVNTVAKWENNHQTIPQTLEVLMILLEYRDNRLVIEKKYLPTP